MFLDGCCALLLRSLGTKPDLRARGWMMSHSRPRPGPTEESGEEQVKPTPPHAARIERTETAAVVVLQW